jgi:hypothetical protein
MVQDLATGRHEALGGGVFPVYSRSGHLIFQMSAENHDLLAAPFSLRSLRLNGERFLLRQNVRCPSVAGDGTLVYLE